MKVERCVCARKTTTVVRGRKVEKIIGKSICPVCKGVGLTATCSNCGGAGLMPHSTFAVPVTCDGCRGTGKVPWKT